MYDCLTYIDELDFQPVFQPNFKMLQLFPKKNYTLNINQVIPEQKHLFY